MKNARNPGFTLVEVLVTMVFMGIMVSAIYGLYLETQKTAISQEEVIELQQNLRIAMDQLARDIRMAGFLVFIDHPPIQSAPNHPDNTEKFIINTACPSGRSACLDKDIRIESSTEATFRLARPEMVDLFAVDDQVRIVRPPDQSQPIAKLFHVTGTNRIARTVTVGGFDPHADMAQYQAGDTLIASSATFPGTISFYLKDNEIYKQLSDGNAQRVTAKKMRGANLINGITGFDLEYVMDDGDTQQAVAASALSEVRAVRVVLTGRAQIQDRTSFRNLASVISLRNR